MSASETSGRSIIIGSIAGIVAWLFGYVFTYAIVAPDIRETALNQLIEAFEGAPATYEMVGWVFYNAHFVDTVFSDIPLFGSRSTTFIGGEDGFTTLLFVIPPALLLAAGLAMARFQGADTPTTGVWNGVTVLPGYLLLAIAGTFFFQVSTIAGTGAPDLLPAVVVAGIVYPLLFAGIGGALGGYFERSEQSSTAEQ